MGHGIAITGEGIVCAIGTNKQSVAHNLRLGHTGIGPMRYLKSVHDELPVGEVKLSNVELKCRLGISEYQEISRTTLLGIMAVTEAVTQARVPTDKSVRVLLISGTTVAGMDITENKFGRMKTDGVGSECLNHHDCGSCSADIAAHFGFFSDYTTISTACSSAANALIFGADLLKAGEADIVVAGGTEALSKFHLNGFNSLMILDHEPCKPFDRDRNGLNLGEGAAYVVLERAEDAARRGATVDAWLNGYGNSCDAYHQTATTPEGIGAQMAMRQALNMAALKPQSIQWIHAHGTGTQNNDQSESNAIESVFAESVPPISSTKGLTGHTTSASGSLSTVISIIAMRQGFVPGNAGYHNAMEKSIIPTLGIAHTELHNVMVNSFGFGGNDSSLIISDRPNDSVCCPIVQGEIVELAHDVNQSIDTLGEIKQFVSPMAVRRMGRLLKSALLTSLRALKESGIRMPDGIVTGTAWGTMEYSEQLLRQLQEGEDALKPTYFMQSTHNTVGSMIAIQLGCHGYNITFSQGGESREWALRQARLLLRLGRCKSVLVGCHDESTELFNVFMIKMGRQALPPVNSEVSVLAIRHC